MRISYPKNGWYEKKDYIATASASFRDQNLQKSFRELSRPSSREVFQVLNRSLLSIFCISSWPVFFWRYSTGSSSKGGKGWWWRLTAIHVCCSKQASAQMHHCYVLSEKGWLDTRFFSHWADQWDIQHFWTSKPMFERNVWPAFRKYLEVQDACKRYCVFSKSLDSLAHSFPLV